MPWNWFQDKDSSFLRERSAGGRKTGIGVAQSGIGIDVPRRRCGFHAPGRAGCSPPRPDKVPCGGNPVRMPTPVGQQAPAAPRGAGDAGRNRNRGSFSRNRVGWRCGTMRYLCIGRDGAPPMREVDAQLLHTSHNTSPDRHPRPASSRRGSPPPSDQRTKKNEQP